MTNVTFLSRLAFRPPFSLAARPIQKNHVMKNEPSKQIDDYIAGFPREIQARLQKLRAVIRKAAPDATETIKYRMPTFVLNGNLVHFAAFPKHIGFYPTPSAIQAFSAELEDYESAKGSVQFPLDKPVPSALIQRMVAFRVSEAQGKVGFKKRKREPQATGTWQAQDKTPITK